MAEYCLLCTPEFPLNLQLFCLSAILWDTNYIPGLLTSNEPVPGTLNLDSLLLLRDFIFETEHFNIQVQDNNFSLNM